jgi:hypothetical protein
MPVTVCANADADSRRAATRHRGRRQRAPDLEMDMNAS